VPSPETWADRLLTAPHAARLGRLLLYLGAGAVTFYLMLLLGTLIFPDAVSGPTALWQDLYQEAAMLLGAMWPAFLMGHLEERPIDDYGLPRHQAFGKLFWAGAIWGLAAITVLLVTMRGAHILYFGHLALHGARILRFAAFWGVFFVVVGLFEEFMLRGYTLFTLAQSTGFWPAAAILSCAFGAIHLRNPGEGWVGALGAAAIGFFFCLTLRRTGTLWFAVGFHAAWDWGETYLYAVPNSGTYEPGHLLSPTFNGPPWLTGGSVGPEGSVLCFVLLALLWVVFHRAYPQVKYKELVS
jgi:membrane protease YdiL (CAAX protease family)